MDTVLVWTSGSLLLLRVTCFASSSGSCLLVSLESMVASPG